MKTELFCILFLVFAVVCPSSAFANDVDDLFWAANRGDIKRVRSLLSGGADVNAKHASGLTALWIAAAKGHTEIVKILLEGKADVKTKITGGGTALMVAAQNGHTDIVKALLESKADVNAKHASGLTALWTAAAKGHTEIVKILLEGKADVNAKGTNGVTALGIATQKSHTDIVKLLLERGAEVNIKRKTDGATAEGYSEIVKILMENGADVYAYTPKEPPLVVDFLFPATSEDVGSITLRPTIPSGRLPGVYFPRSDHPGDELRMAMGEPGPNGKMLFTGRLTPQVAAGEGSEVRFVAEALPVSLLNNIPAVSCQVRVQGKPASVHPAPGSTLCFKRNKGKWVYLCGQGYIKIEEEASWKYIELGKGRDAKTCLALLESMDSVVQEGAARDLGRLVEPADVRAALGKLAALLAHEYPSLRRASAEALGRIGTAECFVLLEQAHTTEGDILTKARIAESLSLCAAFTLVGRTGAPDLAPVAAAKYYAEGTGWVNIVINEYFLEHGIKGYSEVLKHAKSESLPLRESALKIIFSLIPKGKVVREELIAQAVKKGWDAKMHSDGFTLLHLCALYDASLLGELLLSQGAEVNATIKQYTPLYLAAAYGGEEMVRVLLAHGADPSLKIKGKTAKDAAIEAGFLSIATLFDKSTLKKRM